VLLSVVSLSLRLCNAFVARDHSLTYRAYVRAVDALQNARLREPCLPQASTVSDDSEGHLVYKEMETSSKQDVHKISLTSDALRHRPISVVFFCIFQLLQFIQRAHQCVPAV